MFINDFICFILDINYRIFTESISTFYCYSSDLICTHKLPYHTVIPHCTCTPTISIFFVNDNLIEMTNKTCTFVFLNHLIVINVLMSSVNVVLMHLMIDYGSINSYKMGTTVHWCYTVN